MRAFVFLKFVCCHSPRNFNTHCFEIHVNHVCVSVRWNKLSFWVFVNAHFSFVYGWMLINFIIQRDRICKSVVFGFFDSTSVTHCSNVVYNRHSSCCEHTWSYRSSARCARVEVRLSQRSTNATGATRHTSWQKIEGNFSHFGPEGVGSRCWGVALAFKGMVCRCGWTQIDFHLLATGPIICGQFSDALWNPSLGSSSSGCSPIILNSKARVDIRIMSYKIWGSHWSIVINSVIASNIWT